MNPGFSPRRWAWLALVAACLPFLAGLPGGFLFDDFPTIVHSDRVKLESLSLEGLWQAAFAYDPTGGLPRPLVNASFALNHWLSGLEPSAFKLTNIVLHACNGLLVYALISRLLVVCGHLPAVAKPLAVLATTVWLAHPLQVSTVLYVVQRMEMVCTTFTLLAMLGYVNLRVRMIQGHPLSWPLATGTVVATALAWTAKENAALIPYFLLGIEALVFRCRAANPAASQWLRRGVFLGILLGTVAAIGLYAYGLSDPSRFAARDFGPGERLASQAVILPFYLGLIFVPRLDAMVFYYDHWWLRTWGVSEVAIGATMLVGLLVLAAWLRNRRPLVSLGIAWFFTAHLLTSAPFPLELAFEHRNYMALVGIVIALVGIFEPRRDPFPAKFWALPCVLVFALAAATTLRAAYWADASLLARYLVDINPGSARAALDLGERYMLAANRNPDSPLAAAAIAEYERAMALPHGSILGEHAAVLMAAQFGMPQRPEWWQSMVRKLRDDPLRPQDVDALAGVVEQRLEGLAVEDAPLLEATLTAARRGTLAPELVLLFATHAVEGAQDYAGAVELFARGRFAARNDAEYLQRIDDGIERIGGAALLESVNAWQADHLSPPQ